MMRRWVLLVAAVVFLAGLFLDTAGVIELSWLCLRGQCGLPVRFVLPGLGLLIAGGALLIRPAAPAPGPVGRRRTAATAGGKPKPKIAKPGAQAKIGSVAKAVTKPGVTTPGVKKPISGKPAAARPPGRTPASRAPSTRRPAAGQRPR